jgi:predicted HAD superfamily hydrolase
VGLPPADADALIRIEIDYEAQNTRPNPLIQALVAEHRAGGGKVVLVSDMYIRGADIARLLAQHAGTAELADAIFSSADTVVNKRTGTIFNGIANHLAAAPADFFHIGDNFVADYAMPRSAGWNAQHLPIPRSEELRREEDRRLFEASI